MKGQGLGIIMGVTSPLLLGPFYYIAISSVLGYVIIGLTLYPRNRKNKIIYEFLKTFTVVLSSVNAHTTFLSFFSFIISLLMTSTNVLIISFQCK